MSTHVTSADGTRIGYRSIGSGPGVVVVPGALMTGDEYSGLAEKLTGLTAYPMDRRGRGASGPQGDAYDVAAECADVAAVLRATGARYVFGHSYGGLVALQTALREPGLVDRVAVYEPAVSIDGSMPRAFLPAVTTALGAGREARAMALAFRGMDLGGPLDRLPLPVTTAATWLLLRTAGRSMRTALAALPAEITAGLAVDGPAAQYAPIEARALVLTGTRGPAWLHTAATVAEAIPDARHTDLPGLHHGGPQDAPEKVAAELVPFFTT